MFPGTFVPRSECSQALSFLVVSSLSDHGKGCLQYADVAILVKNHRIFPFPQYFCPSPKKGFPWNWVPAMEIKNANDGAIGPKRSLTITSTYVTDGYIDQLEETGDTEVADHLIESLDAARC